MNDANGMLVPSTEQVERLFAREWLPDSRIVGIEAFRAWLSQIRDGVLEEAAQEAERTEPQYVVANPMSTASRIRSMKGFVMPPDAYFPRET